MTMNKTLISIIFFAVLLIIFAITWHSKKNNTAKKKINIAIELPIVSSHTLKENRKKFKTYIEKKKSTIAKVKSAKTNSTANFSTFTNKVSIQEIFEGKMKNVKVPTLISKDEISLLSREEQIVFASNVAAYADFRIHWGKIGIDESRRMIDYLIDSKLLDELSIKDQSALLGNLAAAYANLSKMNFAVKYTKLMLAIVRGSDDARSIAISCSLAADVAEVRRLPREKILSYYIEAKEALEPLGTSNLLQENKMIIIKLTSKNAKEYEKRMKEFMKNADPNFYSYRNGISRLTLLLMKNKSEEWLDYAKENNLNSNERPEHKEYKRFYEIVKKSLQ